MLLPLISYMCKRDISLWRMKVFKKNDSETLCGIIHQSHRRDSERGCSFITLITTYP